MSNEFKRVPTCGENDVDLRVATEPRRVTDAVLPQIIAAKDGEIAALTAEVTHLAEKLAERDASLAGLMKPVGKTTLADFGGDQANYDAWKKFQASAVPQPVDAAQAVPELTVWEGPMPESNGKSNFTAILQRKGAHLFDTAHFTIARSEYPDRVRYEADCVRHIIGEIAEWPCILDYDADKHSGYAAPLAQPTDTTKDAP